jgi:DNA-binding transcriptional regulator YhcF (GntR family)
MKIIKQQEPEKIVCFCPYCKAFSKYPNKFKPSDKKRGFPFQCYACKKYFNDQTYIEQKNNKKRHHCNNECKNIKQLIADFIIELYKKGYSHRDIQKMTHLSRTRIQETTNQKKTTKEVSIEKFLTNNLKIDEHTPLQEKINKALNYGCSKNMVLKLFHTSYKMIDKVYIKNHSNRKHKVKNINDKIVLNYY